MTKEIIIDGVNVAECEYYEDMHECPDNLNGGYYIQHCYCGLQGDNYCICNKNHNCYFKQLKRLEQERDELQDKYSKMIHKYNDLYEKYRAKEILEPQLKDEIKRLDMLSIKYESALEEIRKNIAKLIAKKGYAETEEDFILAKTIEVLND